MSEEGRKDWEDLFIEKNKKQLCQYINAFHPKSFRGILFLGMIQLIVLILFPCLFKTGISTTILYIGTIFLTFVFIVNLPNVIIQKLFYQKGEEVFEEVDYVKLKGLVELLHSWKKISNDYYQSIFVKFDLLTISGVATIVFGLIILIRAVPLYIVLQIIIFIIIIILSVGVRYILKDNNEEKK